MIRDDLSDKLIHLTRGNTYVDAAGLFSKILEERRLLTSGLLIGDLNADAVLEFDLRTATSDRQFVSRQPSNS